MNEEATTKKTKRTRLAVILIRGRTGFNHDVKQTLDQLRLQKKHVCVIIPDNDTNKGMLNKAKDAITWGEINDETLKLLDEKRKKTANDKAKKHYHLHPPRGGFERKGIKQPYNKGGALGDRGSKINDLITRML